MNDEHKATTCADDSLWESRRTQLLEQIKKNRQSIVESEKASALLKKRASSFPMVIEALKYHGETADVLLVINKKYKSFKSPFTIGRANNNIVVFENGAGETVAGWNYNFYRSEHETFVSDERYVGLTVKAEKTLDAWAVDLGYSDIWYLILDLCIFENDRGKNKSKLHAIKNWFKGGGK